MNLLAPLILQNLKKILKANPELWGCTIFWSKKIGPNGLFVLKKFFLVQTIIISFVYILALFTVQNLKQFLQWILGYEGAPFLGPNSPFAPIFFWKINIIPIYLSAPFIEQNVKKILLMVPELWGRTIFGPNMAHFTKWEFFQKTCCWALFFFFIHVYLHAKNQSQILIY